MRSNLVWRLLFGAHCSSSRIEETPAGATLAGTRIPCVRSGVSMAHDNLGWSPVETFVVPWHTNRVKSQRG
jgi:hypothetical protein